MRLNQSFLCVAALLLVCAQAGPTAALGRKCADSPLKEGAVAGRDDLRLGPPVVFDDGVGITTGRCHQLSAGGRALAWVIDVREAAGRLLVWRCVEDPAVTDVEPGARGGYFAEGYEELTSSGGTYSFKEVRLPLWGHFSNPSFCGAGLAYWGTEPARGGKVRAYAMLFDLGPMRLTGKRLAGTLAIESDSPDFFPPPRWSATGAAVTFDAGATPDPSAPRRALRRITLRPAR
ncbi:MAG: hypothetical protein JOZ96_22620 [Acidobacteria bacterium]|nr:hypothetical protein [Acidobacteriota bacterium]